MLTLLHIENIAVIERADISFGAGLNILTGETGAGKSILIDALNAALGERTSRDIIRSGTDAAVVSAMFSPLSDSVRQWLSNNGAGTATDDELLISREIHSDGRNLCRINGKPITVMLLRSIGSLLVNIHGQHDSQLLLNESSHLGYLDSFGNTAELLTDYREHYRALLAIRKELEALKQDSKEKDQRVESLKSRIDEIESARIEPGELEALETRLSILRNSEKLTGSLETAYALLFGDQENDGICSELATAENALGAAASLSDQYEDVRSRVQELIYSAEDAASDIRSFLDDLEYSPDELEELTGRVDLINRLCRKYGCAADGILDLCQNYKDELDKIEFADEKYAKLRADLEHLHKKTVASAAKLSRRRAESAKELEARILDELSQLDMGKVSFSVAMGRYMENNSQRLSPNGIDEVKFLISTNSGEPLKPLAKVASGGELARVMLAMKNVLAMGDSVATLVFDEVDAGVSGRAALKVGIKLAQVAEIKQVLCVTHLPQIAASAGTHFRIHKSDSGERTTTCVDLLSFDGRVDEIARLIGGSTITENTRLSARELISGQAFDNNDRGVI